MSTRTYPDQIQIISAPSILGLRPTGVENLAGALLDAGLAKELDSKLAAIEVPTLNDLYNAKRDSDTNCLNSNALVSFSKELMPVIFESMGKQHFPVVLGGDCSILLGIMPALKQRGTYGLIFADVHADFYSPEKSITGEVADMDLAIVTGHGPELLTDIHDLKSYVSEENVVHIGQRDEEETKQYTGRRTSDIPISRVLILKQSDPKERQPLPRRF